MLPGSCRFFAGDIVGTVAGGRWWLELWDGDEQTALLALPFWPEVLPEMLPEWLPMRMPS